MIYPPNKIFYYFAAGLAVLNTITGQCSRIIHEDNCGLDYRPGDVDSCVQAIKQIITNRKELSNMQHNSPRLAETKYDRKVIYPRYIELIEKLVESSLD